MADYIEGDTATNPQTGETLVFKSGKWQSLPAVSGRTFTNVIPSAFNKGVAGVVDLLLNTPTNIANLGVSGAGLAAQAAGYPEAAERLAGYITPQPNYAQRLFEKVGAIDKSAEPTTRTERILGAGSQAAGGSMFDPAAGASFIRTVVPSILGSVAGQATTEATGSPLAGALTSLATPAGVSYGAGAATRKVNQLAQQKALREPSDAITTAGMERGYVLPPTEQNPTAINRLLESLGGKAAVRQSVELRNQEVTNRLVREQLGLPPNAPITEDALEKLRSQFSAPYEAIRKIPPYREQVATNQIDTLTNTPIMRSVEVNPNDILDQLRVARANSKQWYAAFARDAHPETEAKAIAYKNEANVLENKLEDIANKTGNPDLVNQLREARRNIAQTYTVENALNASATNVNARNLAKALEKGVPLTGNLKLSAQFAQQNPLYTREASGVSTPGVDALRTVGGAMMAASGNVVGALPAFAGAPARGIALSGPYQRRFAVPRNYDPGMIAKALKDYSPFEQQLILARMAGLQAQEQQ